MTGWSAYDKLNIEFLDDKLTKFNQNITKNYSDSWAYRLGAQYALTNRFDLRAGCYIDTTPVDDNHYNPETPGMTRVCPSVGFSFRPIERVSIDLAFTYVAGLGADNKNCNYDDLVAAQQYAQNPQLAQLNVFGPVQKTFTADYKLNALIPAIGVSYSF
jgi:long-chain fatty acid transport protein